MNIGFWKGIKTRLGVGTLKGAVSPVVYTLKVNFSTDDAAPISNPYVGEVGSLATVDSGSKASVSGGELIFNGVTGAGDPGVWGGLQILAAGLAFYAQMRAVPNDATYIEMGWDTGQSGALNSRARLRPNLQNIALYVDGSDTVDYTTYARNTTHEFLMVHKGGAAGVLVFGKPNGGSWELMWTGQATVATQLYPGVQPVSYVSSNLYADNLRVTVLPTPFNSATGLATQVLAGARSQGDVFTHDANCFIDFTVTTRPSSGQQEIQFRKQDETNYWQVTIDSSGNLDLDEVVAGTPTQRGTSAGVVVSGDKIKIKCVGNRILVYEGASGQAERINYASATNFATATSGSLLSLGTGGAISQIEIYPRTISGAALTAINAAFP